MANKLASTDQSMDHGHYRWSAMPFRPRLRLPAPAKVALCAIVNLEHYDFEAVPNSFTASDGNRGRGPSPDVRMYSLRDYGNRIGIYRVLKVLDKHGIRATAAIDATVAGHFPNIVEECRRRGWEFAGHGLSATQMITSRMSAEQENDYITRTLIAIKRATGEDVIGWLGPDYGESARTPALLAQLGIRYVLDWPNDEQPYRMIVPNGDLISIPTLLELDDVYAHWHRRITIDRWRCMIEEAFDTLYAEGRKSARILTLQLHPWLIGQPHRIKCLDDALGYITRHADVWIATGREIAAWYRDNETGVEGGP